MKNTTKRSALWAALLLGAALSAYAVPVTFTVDMGYQITLGNFNTDGSDHIELKSGFNNNPGWPGYEMTNIAPTTLYSVTVDITSPAPGTDIQYKFHTWGTHDVWEPLAWYPSSNRRFTLASSAQVVPTAYFGDAWAGGAGTEVFFQVDMSPQVGVGNFKPELGDLIQVMGALNSSWNGFALTNDPAGANTNLYSGSYVETGRPPGTRIEYKLAINVGGGGTLQYESIAGYPDNNRAFVLSEASFQALPALFFSDATGYPIQGAIYFQLDLSSQILTRGFNPATDLASVRGDAVGWGDPPASGLQLFEDTSRPGIYTNTYRNASQLTGAAWTYKFSIFHPSPASTVWEDGDNKSVTFAGTEPTDPQGYHLITVGPNLFNNFLANTNDYLPADTLVTFTVSMTNAQSYAGFSDPPLIFTKSMGVAVNGSFWPWWNWNQAPPVALNLTNDTTGDDWIYSQTVLFPKGSAVQMWYKYGIDDQTGVTSLNNEAPDGQDRMRFIRQTGSYTLPLDHFGTQTVETSFGDLTVGQPSGGSVPVSWLGRPGVFLQTSSALNNPGAWVTHYETANNGSPSGIYSTNYPTALGPTYFRLVKPGQ